MDIFSFDFFRRSLLAALLSGPTCALLGVITTSRGQAFFSDSLAHSTIAGYGLGLLIQLLLSQLLGISFSSVFISSFMFFYCLGVSLLFILFLNKTRLESDTLLSLIFTGSVALGILILTKMIRYPFLESLLFGDINACSWTDVLLLGLVSLSAFFFLFKNMPGLLLLMIDENMAVAEGVQVKKLNYQTVILIGGIIALSLKLLGAILVSAMIVIPAATAKLLAWNFRSLLFLSLLYGLLGAVGGVLLSYYIDAMTGPTIGGFEILLLLFSFFIKKFFKKKDSKKQLD
ncbi:metal ABC transporter permease [Methylacidiphilum caldifontis]|uniref:metal ABC transporter permease n=1 Tax=Methylacidiphilum caldifontis TaxID=2795386 RepID=UPI001A8FAE39|nr:metal ABC transporter permease [Methylacidiphilum caldifontis]QSR88535.1 metal ABC transporter permease [Methylacidiphilum caldifontis]